MGAVIIALRRSDHERLYEIAAERGMSPKDMAGVLLEEAIRREMRQARDDAEPEEADDA
jgi:predicted DsbA family dithiol-disulfide isomerase